MLFRIIFSGGLLKSCLGYIIPKRFLFVSTIPWGALPLKVTFYLNFHLRLLEPLRNVNWPHKQSMVKNSQAISALPTPMQWCLLADHFCTVVLYRLSLFPGAALCRVFTQSCPVSLMCRSASVSSSLYILCCPHNGSSGTPGRWELLRVNVPFGLSFSHCLVGILYIFWTLVLSRLYVFWISHEQLWLCYFQCFVVWMLY